MAILIPSKNIYDKDNDKVRDNKIDRIEVSAVEVKDIQQFGTNVFSKTITDIKTYQKQQENSSYSSISQKQTKQHPTFLNYNEYNSHSYIDVSISIPRLQGTYLIEQLLFGKKTDNSLNIGCSIFGDVTTETVGGTVNVSLSKGENDWFTATITSKNLTYSNKETSQENYAIPNELEINSYNNVNISGVSVPSNKTKILSSDTLPSAVPTSDEDYFYIQLTILCGIQTLSFSADTFGITTNNVLTVYKGERKTYTPKSIELQFYGNTIGIDLTDKTVYIPENNKTSKKVFSVDGNELMQTSNYIPSEQIPVTIGDFISKGNTFSYCKAFIPSFLQDWWHLILNYNGEQATITDYNENEGYYTLLVLNYIDDKLGGVWLSQQGKTVYATLYGTNEQFKIKKINSMFSDTLTNYKNSKETATIRCDISDYYEYDPTATNHKGAKVIDIENFVNGRRKMFFEMYDKVIPMSYGANGEDRPLSKYQNGKPKVFEVLGTQIFYDGAVWQELTLQETLE